jgi:hypothetical protein
MKPSVLVTRQELSRQILKSIGDDQPTNWVQGHVTKMFSAFNQCIKHAFEKLDKEDANTNAVVVTLPYIGEVVKVKSATDNNYKYVPTKQLQKATMIDYSPVQHPIQALRKEVLLDRLSEACHVTEIAICQLLHHTVKVVGQLCRNGQHVVLDIQVSKDLFLVVGPGAF